MTPRAYLLKWGNNTAFCPTIIEAANFISSQRNQRNGLHLVINPQTALRRFGISFCCRSAIPVPTCVRIRALFKGVYSLT